MLNWCSLDPDNNLVEERKSGLGIFILDPSKDIKLFIRAQPKNCSSVLMAESIATSLASDVCERLGFNHTIYFTDNQIILASCFNGGWPKSPPDWRIKPYTWNFLKQSKLRITQVFKIDRSHNITAHSLAKQAFRANTLHSDAAVVVCTNPNHVSGCPIHVLNGVMLKHCNYFAAVCCR